MTSNDVITAAAMHVEVRSLVENLSRKQSAARNAADISTEDKGLKEHSDNKWLISSSSRDAVWPSLR